MLEMSYQDKNYLQARAFLETFFRAHLPAKRRDGGDDLFAQLCRAQSEDGHEFSDDDIVNHMIFLLMAAHDTTTITLTTDDNGVTSETRQTVNGPLVTATSTFNDLNRLTELSSDASGSVLTTYGYDNNGNLTSTTQNSQVTAQFEYDCRDQLRRVRNGGGQEIAAYDYDFERHRLAKTVGASSLKYVYGGNQVIGEYNSDNQLQNRYDLGADEVVRAELGGEGSRHYFGDGSKSVTAVGPLFGIVTLNVKLFGSVSNNAESRTLNVKLA